jgi:RimJ/RimL family protein N-acetyltransferase
MASERTETARLRLERWDEEHDVLLIHLSSIPRVMRYIGLGDLWTQSSAEEIAARQRDHWKKHGFGWRAAVEKATDRQVGFMALNFAGEGTVGLLPDEYEIGWWLEPEAWGRGLAREGAEALCDEAFDRLAAPSVVARIQPGNQRSISVAEGVGLNLDFETTGAVGEPVHVYRRLVDGA